MINPHAPDGPPLFGHITARNLAPSDFSFTVEFRFNNRPSISDSVSSNTDQLWYDVENNSNATVAVVDGTEVTIDSGSQEVTLISTSNRTVKVTFETSQNYPKAGRITLWVLIEPV